VTVAVAVAPGSSVNEAGETSRENWFAAGCELELQAAARRRRSALLFDMPGLY
jgi:hypothetical protein